MLSAAEADLVPQATMPALDLALATDAQLLDSELPGLPMLADQHPRSVLELAETAMEMPDVPDLEVVMVAEATVEDLPVPDLDSVRAVPDLMETPVVPVSEEVTVTLVALDLEQVTVTEAGLDLAVAAEDPDLVATTVTVVMAEMEDVPDLGEVTVTEARRAVIGSLLLEATKILVAVASSAASRALSPLRRGRVLLPCRGRPRTVSQL